VSVRTGDLERCSRQLESGLQRLESGLRRLEACEGVSWLVVQRDDDCLALPARARVQELASKMQLVLLQLQRGNHAEQQRDYGEAERQYTAALAVREVTAPAFSAALYGELALLQCVRSSFPL
jgi:hypothetical protein